MSPTKKDIIKNWLKTRSTIEFLGTWEALYNPSFKVVEFDHFRKEAGRLPEKIFGKRPQNEKDEKEGRINYHRCVSLQTQLPFRWPQEPRQASRPIER